MNAALQVTAPAALSRDALRRRLRELAGDERQVQVEFLLHLAEFDERKGFAEAGYDSLWTYCLRELHLREGPTARRIGAMRVLRQYPGLETPLRDGRLCLSTVTLIAPLLRETSLDDVVSRAAYKTKLEVEQLVASLRPRAAPRDGVRLVALRSAPASQPAKSATTVVPATTSGALFLGARVCTSETDSAPTSSDTLVDGAGRAHRIAASPEQDASSTPVGESLSPDQSHALPRGSDCGRNELRPVSAEQWSLRVTMDVAMKEDLETLKYLLSHKSGGDLTAVLREALRCAVEKHGKRRGLIPPTRARRRADEESRAGAEQTDLAGPDGTAVCSDTAAAQSAAPPEAVRAGMAISADTAAPANPIVPSGAEPNPAGEDRPRAEAARSTRPAHGGGTPAPRSSIPAHVRRAVWKRDGNCCAFVSADGQRCGSRWKLELDHVRPVSVGGESTVENVRVACRTHNMLYAERAFGREFMERQIGARGRGAGTRRERAATSRAFPGIVSDELFPGSGTSRSRDQRRAVPGISEASG